MDLNYFTIKAGTVLYHGTSGEDFDESEHELSGPAWVTDSVSVAEHFALRRPGEPNPRVASYMVTRDIELPEIVSNDEMDDLAEEYNLDLMGIEGMCDSLLNSSLAGWYLPYNYPDGADILIRDTDALEYQSSTPVLRDDTRHRM